MLHHHLSLSLNLKKLRYHQKMPLLLPPPPAIRVTKHLMLKKRERLLLSSLLSHHPSQQVPVQTEKLVSTAWAVQSRWVHVHGAAWLGLTVTCALVRSSVTEEHATGVCRELPAGLWFFWPQTPQTTHTPSLFNEPAYNTKHFSDNTEFPVQVWKLATKWPRELLKNQQGRRWLLKPSSSYP